jgi:hypothetical protein
MSKVLTLKGVTTRDIQTAEQIMEQKLEQNAGCEMGEHVKSKPSMMIRHTYKAHPKNITVDPAEPMACDWVKSTNIKCNTCLRTFNSMPLFMPTYIDNKTKKLEIGTEGNFCSYTCIITHIDIKFPNLSCGANQSKYKQMVYIIYKLFTGKTIKHIEPSPMYTCMEEFGGNMTAIEYYKKIDNMNQFCNMTITNHTIKPSRDGLSKHEKIAGKSIENILYGNQQSFSDESVSENHFTIS